MGMYKKPTLGLKPKYVHDEERKVDIKRAIARYLDDDKVIPIEWIDELNKLNCLTTTDLIFKVDDKGICILKKESEVQDD